jgi:hypothetical protein
MISEKEYTMDLPLVRKKHVSEDLVRVDRTGLDTVENWVSSFKLSREFCRVRLVVDKSSRHSVCYGFFLFVTHHLLRCGTRKPTNRYSSLTFYI